MLINLQKAQKIIHDKFKDSTATLTVEVQYIAIGDFLDMHPTNASYKLLDALYGDHDYSILNTALVMSLKRPTHPDVVQATKYAMTRFQESGGGKGKYKTVNKCLSEVLKEMGIHSDSIETITPQQIVEQLKQEYGHVIHHNMQKVVTFITTHASEAIEQS